MGAEGNRSHIRCGSRDRARYSTRLTSPPSTAPQQEEEEEEEGSQGGQLCPTYQPRIRRGLTRKGLWHTSHRWGRALPFPPSHSPLCSILFQLLDFRPSLTATFLLDAQML